MDALAVGKSPAWWLKYIACSRSSQRDDRNHRGNDLEYNHHLGWQDRHDSAMWRGPRGLCVAISFRDTKKMLGWKKPQRFLRLETLFLQDRNCGKFCCQSDASSVYQTKGNIKTKVRRLLLLRGSTWRTSSAMKWKWSPVSSLGWYVQKRHEKLCCDLDFSCLELT